jgi:transcriptional regulator with XRE-family HTH domain
MAKTDTSQAKLAARLTEQFAIAGQSLERPINQSTVSAWKRHVSTPGGAMLIALHQIAKIPVGDWFVSAADESGSHDVVASKATGT